VIGEAGDARRCLREERFAITITHSMPAKRAASATSADQDVVAKVRRIAEDMTRASEATAKEALRTLRASAKNLSSMSERSGEKEVTALAEVHTIMRQYKKSARELQSNEKSALQALGAEVQQVARDQHHGASDGSGSPCPSVLALVSLWLFMRSSRRVRRARLPFLLARWPRLRRMETDPPPQLPLKSSRASSRRHTQLHQSPPRRATLTRARTRRSSGRRLRAVRRLGQRVWPPRRRRQTALR
jgi:hypothetical protein